MRSYKFQDNCYKPLFRLQHLNPNGKPHRVEFASDMLAHHEDDPTILQWSTIQFSDEVAFHVCARVNKGNCGICMR